MAIDDDGGGERTRFPCLATVRYVVAAVVSVLTVVVVVMVITVALRPVNIRLSILQGYIEADTLWQEVTTTTTNGAATTISGKASMAGHRPRAPVIIGSGTGVNDGGAVLGGGVGVGYDSGADNNRGGFTYTYYEAAEYVNLVVTLRADNPSGRADLGFHNITVRILDMPTPDYSSTNKMTEIGTFPVLDRSIIVERESSYTLRTLLTVSDKAVLSHIAGTYGGRTSFQAMLQVNATTTTTAEKKKKDKVISHYCWPVTVGSYYASSAARDEVVCKTREEMSYTFPLAPSY